MDGEERSKEKEKEEEEGEVKEEGGVKEEEVKEGVTKVDIELDCESKKSFANDVCSNKKHKTSTSPQHCRIYNTV